MATEAHMLDTSSILARRIEEFASWCHERGAQQDKATTVTTPLYHYTDLGALKGIICNQEFWFTDILHLNDPSEFVHGTEMALRMVREHPLRSDRGVDFLCKPLEDTIRRRFNEIFAIHIASFSGLNDNLSQWREYGAHGKGVAIALAPAFFARGAGNEIGPDGKPCHPMIVTPMIYDEAVVQGRLRETLDKAFETVRAMMPVFMLTPAEKGVEYMREFASRLSLEILLEALAAKHPTYRAEAEVRLTIASRRSVLAPSIETRVREGQTIPFVRQKLHVRKDISSVILGPLADAATARAARELLAACDLDADRLIRRSKVPMR
jgi:hypothetical protein